MSVRTTLLAAVMACATVASLAAQVPPEADRTVSWYMHHHDALDRVTAACRNDPGHGHNNPDCINADAARTSLAVEEAKQRSGLTLLQNDPEYWRRHPEELPFELKICSHIPASAQLTNNCPAAWEATNRR